MRAKALGRRNKFTPIGVDVRESSIHAVQFVKRNGDLKLHVAASERITPVTDDTSGVGPAAPALQSLLANHPFVGRAAIGSVPSQDVDVRPIRLSEGVTPGDTDHFRSALKVEARSCLLYSPEEAVLDYVPLGVQPDDEAQRHSVLLVAVKKASVNGHLELLQTAGLDCVHLDVVPCAAARILGEGETAYAAIELDRRQTIVMMVKGTDLLFSRTIKIGFQQFVDELSRALSIGAPLAERMVRAYGIEHGPVTRFDLERLAREGILNDESMRAAIFEVCSRALDRFAKELRRSMDYFALQRRGGAIERVALVGEQVPPGLGEYLSERLSIPVALTNVFSRYTTDDSTLASESACIIAAGLALREEEE